MSTSDEPQFLRDPTRNEAADPDGAALRQTNIERLEAAGFRPARWLPTRGQRADVPGTLRPTREIAGRAMALGAVVLWVAAPDEAVPDDRITALVDRNDLRAFMTDKERAIFDLDRAAARDQHIDTIGWRLENIWALCWVLGFEREPPFDGAMIPDDITGDLVLRFLPADGTVDQLVARVRPRPESEVVALEDLFYCAHNAARSAQVGTTGTVPTGFHPIVNGGVIHERRHALTWVLSPGVAWDDTDLST